MVCRQTRFDVAAQWTMLTHFQPIRDAIRVETVVALQLRTGIYIIQADDAERHVQIELDPGSHTRVGFTIFDGPDGDQKSLPEVCLSHSDDPTFSQGPLRLCFRCPCL